MTRRQLVVGAVASSLVAPGRARAEDPFAALAVTRGTRPPREFSAAALRGWAPAGSPPGGTVSLERLRGRIVFLNFWATWCPPCREEMPAIERLFRRYRERGFAVLALSVDTDGEAAVVPFLEEHGLSFPIGLDPDMRVASLYGVRALPSTFLLDRRGRTVGTAIGPRQWDGPEAHVVVERLLAES